jgi:transposase-like protein
VTDDQWVDLLRHVCFNYDDLGLMIYIVGRIRAEGIVVPELPMEPPAASEPASPPVLTTVQPLADATPSTNGHHEAPVAAEAPYVRPTPIPRTRAAGKARWTDEEALEMKHLYFTHQRSITDMAADHGVSVESVRQMIRRESYKHLPVTLEEEAFERAKRHTARRVAAAQSLFLDGEKAHA